MAEETTNNAGPEQLKQMAHDYQVPMSDTAIKQIAGDGADESKVKAFGEYLKTTAQGLYPSFAPQIATGIPTAYLLEPYRQTAKQILGENFEPDFMNDPKSAAALMGSRDEKTGRPVPMSLDEWRRHIRTEPGFNWGYTADAHNRVNTILRTLKNGLQGGQ
jgi:hypothetical protein